MTEPKTEAVPARQQQQDPAGQAAGHLRAAARGLREAYDHPHHSPRLDQIETQLRNLEALVAELPAAEEQRAEYAARLMDDYRNRRLPPTLPDHAELLLSQELQRNTR